MEVIVSLVKTTMQTVKTCFCRLAIVYHHLTCPSIVPNWKIWFVDTFPVGEYCGFTGDRHIIQLILIIIKTTKNLYDA